MDSKTLRHLMRNPKAMMTYHATGRLPRIVEPASPLIVFLETLSPRDRQYIQGVRLSPKLGYRSGAQFRTAEQLYNWLKPVVAERHPVSESHKIAAFTTPISFEVFAEHCHKIPASIAARYTP